MNGRDHHQPTLDALGERVSALEHDLDRLSVLVDGQEVWSHRKRLHTLENNAHAATLAHAALEAYRKQRDNTWTRVREWGSFALAVAAIIIAGGHGL